MNIQAKALIKLFIMNGLPFWKDKHTYFRFFSINKEIVTYEVNLDKSNGREDTIEYVCYLMGLSLLE